MSPPNNGGGFSLHTLRYTYTVATRMVLDGRGRRGYPYGRYCMSDQTGLIIPDLHAPYHDRRAFALALRVGAYLKPRFLVSLGDFPDNYQISDHLRDPRRKLRFADEMRIARECRQQLDDLKAERKLLTKGNHEWRFDRFVIRQAPELYDAIDSIEEMMGFPHNGWEVKEYGDFGKIGRMHFTHCIDGKAGPTAHRAACADFEGNVCIGHTHQLASHYMGNIKGESHVGVTLGWLGDAKKTDYKHRVKAAKEWALGFGVAHMRSDGVMYIQPTPIINYSACVDGRIIRG